MKLVVDRDVSPKSVDEQAAQWFVAMRGKAPSPEERLQFEAWCHQSRENTEAFARIEIIWQESDAIAASPAILAMRQAALAKTPTPQSSLWRTAAAAALVLAVVGSGIFAVSSGRFSQDSMIPKPVAPDHGDFATVVGERSMVTLKDGSVLTLDTNSEARVAYTPVERTIYLLRGQALFDVAKHKPIPFVVHAGDRRVVATGTSFDVRLDRSAVEVTLVEGHVHVDQTSDRSDGKPIVRTELQPGERLVARQNAPVTVAVADVSHVTDWRSGRLTFSDERLDDAIEEVNRYSDTHILLSDDKLRSLRVNGVFRSGQPSDFAEALVEIYPVTVHQNAGGNLVVAWKERRDDGPSQNR